MAASTAAKIVVLITGANRGIGFELAAQLMAKGSYHVLMGSRSIEIGNAALEELQSRNLAGSVEMIPLDMTDDDTIERAATTVQRNHGKLDILVNNAAVVSMASPFRQQMRESFDTNATGPAVVTSLFAPLLQKSTASPRIVNISSGMGSIACRINPDLPFHEVQAVQYRASKTALNMVTACQRVEYEPLGIKVFAFDPGFTQTNISPQNTAENGAKPASEAVMPLIDVLEGKRDKEDFKLLHDTGFYPW